MAKENTEKLFEDILIEIAEQGKPTIRAIQGKMSMRTFWKFLNDNEENVKLYALATQIRAEKIEAETIEIADGEGDDLITLPNGVQVENQRVIARDRLRVDTRKWLLAKLHPKKYGEKVEVEQNQKQTIQYENVSKQYPDKK